MSLLLKFGLRCPISVNFSGPGSKIWIQTCLVYAPMMNTAVLATYVFEATCKWMALSLLTEVCACVCVKVELFMMPHLFQVLI